MKKILSVVLVSLLLGSTTFATLTETQKLEKTSLTKEIALGIANGHTFILKIDSELEKFSGNEEILLELYKKASELEKASTSEERKNLLKYIALKSLELSKTSFDENSNSSEEENIPTSEISAELQKEFDEVEKEILNAQTKIYNSLVNQIENLVEIYEKELQKSYDFNGNLGLDFKLNIDNEYSKSNTNLEAKFEQITGKVNGLDADMNSDFLVKFFDNSYLGETQDISIEGNFNYIQKGQDLFLKLNNLTRNDGKTDIFTENDFFKQLKSASDKSQFLKISGGNEDIYRDITAEDLKELLPTETLKFLTEKALFSPIAKNSDGSFTLGINENSCEIFLGYYDCSDKELLKVVNNEFSKTGKITYKNENGNSKINVSIVEGESSASAEFVFNDSKIISFDANFDASNDVVGKINYSNNNLTGDVNVYTSDWWTGAQNVTNIKTNGRITNKVENLNIDLTYNTADNSDNFVGNLNVDNGNYNFSGLYKTSFNESFAFKGSGKYSINSFSLKGDINFTFPEDDAITGNLDSEFFFDDNRSNFKFLLNGQYGKNSVYLNSFADINQQNRNSVEIVAPTTFVEYSF